jgi:hypothetical protein
MHHAFFSLIGDRDRALDVFPPASKDGVDCLESLSVDVKQ